MPGPATSRYFQFSTTYADDDSGINRYQGSIFYQGISNNIVELLIQCTFSSGECTTLQNFGISSGVTTGVNEETGLAVLLISATAGYRVYYHDSAGQVRELSYIANSANWADGALVSAHNVTSGFGLAATAADKTNVTVYSVLNGTEVYAMEKNVTSSNSTWSPCKTAPIVFETID